VHLLLGLDINIVSISLPVLSQSFSISINEVSRVVWIYFLVVTSFLLLFGKLGDRFGFKKLFNIGIIVFLLGSFFAGLSPDYNFLIVARIVQASGGAVLFALSPALISAYIPPEMRGRIYGFNYAFVALGGIIGR
jgi:MFS family permease